MPLPSGTASQYWSQQEFYEFRIILNYHEFARKRATSIKWQYQILLKEQSRAATAEIKAGPQIRPP
jgi:hypothetical protein